MEKHLCKLQHLTNLQKPDEEYHCGTCAKTFYSICRLHHHMKIHCDEGSYIFDNIFKTAFPRHVTFSSYTQTTAEVESGVVQENNENIDTFSGLDQTIPDVKSNSPEKQSESNATKVAVKDKYKTSSDVTLRKWKKPADKFHDYFASKYALSSGKKCVVKLRKIDSELKGCQNINVSDLHGVGNRSAISLETKLKQRKPSSNNGNESKSLNYENKQAKQTSVNAEHGSNLSHNDNGETNSANVYNFYLKNPDALQECDITNNDHDHHVEDNDNDDDYMDTDNAVSNQNANETSRSDAPCLDPDVRNSFEADTCNKAVFLRKVAIDDENASDINTTTDTGIKQEMSLFNEDDDDVCQETCKQSEQLTESEPKKTSHRNKKSNQKLSKKAQRKKRKLNKIEKETVDVKTGLARDTKKRPKNTSSVSAVEHGNSKRKKKSSVPPRSLCDLCGLEFSRRQYKYHMLKHSGERPHLCNHCGQSFYAKKHLVCHLFQHQTVKPHTCSYCNTGFTQKSELRLHMNIHTGSRPFVCKMCDKSFNHSSNLRFHVKTVHLEEKNHPCPTCKRSFSKKSHLKTHMLGHSEASFECSECMKKFVTPRNLKRHMEQHSSHMFKCVKCDKKLPVLGYLYAHMKRCHDISEKAGADLWRSGAIQSMPLENMTAEQRRDFFQNINKGTRPKNKTPSKKIKVNVGKINQISEPQSTEGSVEQVIP